MIDIELPWGPTANKYWRCVGRGRVLLSADGRAYKKAVAQAVVAQRAVRQLSGPVWVILRFHAPDRRRYDVDNRVKPVLDALQGAGVYLNDFQVNLELGWRGEVERGTPGRISARVLEDPSIEPGLILLAEFLRQGAD